MFGLDTSWIFAVFALIIVIFVMFVVISKRYIKVGPNEVLVISGMRHRIKTAEGDRESVGFRILKGGGTFVIPVFERVDHLSLELFTLDVNTPEVYTAKGVPVMVDGVAQVKIKGDEVSIRTAAEQFLSKAKQEIMEISLQTMEGHLRAILGTMTVEEIYSNRDAFASKVQDVAAADMANMGMVVVSFTIRDIRDKQGYLDALGKPRVAQVKKDARVGEAEADRDATIQSAEARKIGEVGRLEAETKIAAADRDYRMRLAEYEASVNQKKAEADLAYDLQRYKTEQLVKEEEVAVKVVEKTKEIEIGEREVRRKELELNASIERPADAERYRMQTIAEADKFKLQTIAEGQSSAIKLTGSAEADANKARGFAEADVIKAQGLSEAEAMAKKASAWQEYNQAAIAQMLIEKLPEIARAISEPLAKTEKIVIINSGGNGRGGGASKLTGDITEILAQLPPVVESLTGLKFEDILGRIPGVKKERTAEVRIEDPEE
ncbi:MAG: SPFH domain-containing protein [Candidatus Zixiibacteriota bacterium]